MPRVHQLIHIDYKQNRSPHRVLLTGGLRPPLVEPVPKANMHKIRKVISHIKPHEATYRFDWKIPEGTEGHPQCQPWRMNVYIV